MEKKRNTAVFIDGENIPAKKAGDIMDIIKKDKKVTIDYIKVYGIQKDRSTRSWTDVASYTEKMKDIRLYGPPAKNKVDNKIIKDAEESTQRNPNVDIYYIVSSDHGYTSAVAELRKKGKRVVVIGEEKAPKKLRDSANRFILV